MESLEPTAPAAFRPAHRGAVAFGPFRFDPGERLLSRGGAEVALPPRALGILEHLLAHPGRIVGKQELMDAVWRGTFVSETSLAEAVSVLRQALGDDPQSPTYIQTLHRRGYRFIAPAVPSPAARRRVLPPRALAAVLALAVAAGALAALVAVHARPGPPAPVRRLLVAAPEGDSLDADVVPALALAPGGDRLVFAARHAGRQRLYLRGLDLFAALPIPGTEAAAAPFFSPDGGWIGFFAGGRLFKAPLSPEAGGAPIALCASPYPYGASWGRSPRDGSAGFILFSPGYDSGLLAVPAGGGAPQAVTRPDRRAGEVGHRWPEVLPGGRSVLFTVWRTGLADARVELLDLESHRRRLLLTGASHARWAPPGHLVFARGDGLAAVPFDAQAGAVLGPVVAVLDGARVDPAQGGAQFAVGEGNGGTLVYLPGGPEAVPRTLRRAVPGGEDRPLAAPARRYRNLALSPDGSRLALTIREDGQSDLWISDVDRGTLTRLTAGAGAIEPAWSPDGRWIVFAAPRDGRFALYRVAADGSRRELLFAGPHDAYPGGVTPDGRTLAFVDADPATGPDLWALPLAGDRRPVPVLRTSFAEGMPRISPDGRWLAYQSNEAGESEVYVRPWPGPGGKLQVSPGGGSLPQWSADGRRLYYRRGDALFAVDLHPAAGDSTGGIGLAAGPPAAVLSSEELDRYAVAPGGAVLYFARNPEDVAAAHRVHVVLGWEGELSRLAPGPRGRQ